MVRRKLVIDYKKANKNNYKKSLFKIQSIDFLRLYKKNK